jgi:cytoplasmic iron level regulating protein YaaA (DUF328/UPF0246 family)
MLFLLSPAKTLDFESPIGQPSHSAPLFSKDSAQLIALLRGFSPQDLSDLMTVSDKLARLNVARYMAWSSRASVKNARPALLAFDGDVYDGLDAYSLTPDALAWAQDHLCILSGLYGVLRPLDLMQPYRLEMGTRLANAHGKDLYAFWGARISQYLNRRLRSDASAVVVNLASQEYFKAVDRKVLKAPVVECVFQEYRSGQYKLISFMAKRARGLMARYAIDRHLTEPDQLRAFDVEGYKWSAAQSTPRRLVFRRRA